MRHISPRGRHLFLRAGAPAFVTVALALSQALAPLAGSSATPAPAPVPIWLRLTPGALARIDVAPWPAYDEPEAALTAGASSLTRDFAVDFGRPNDVVYQPIGVRVRLVRVIGGRVALVHGLSAAWIAYAPLERVIPEIPPGTRLRAAGGFGGFADFFSASDSPPADGKRVATGTSLVALGMGAARADSGDSDLIRVNVRVLSGPEQGRTGWIPVAFTGVPLATVPAGAEEAARACSCRLVRFDAPSTP